MDYQAFLEFLRERERRAMPDLIIFGKGILLVLSILFCLAILLMTYRGFVYGQVKEALASLVSLIVGAIMVRAIYVKSRVLQIGELAITNTVISEGANGTAVFEGTYEYVHDGAYAYVLEGTPQRVAVKRLDKRVHNDSGVYKKIKNLRRANGHPNIAQLFGVKNDPDYLYVCLEHCICNIGDLVRMFSPHNLGDANDNARMDEARNSLQGIQLWEQANNGDHRRPSPTLLRLMMEMAVGLDYLCQSKRMVHRNLKPENILISNEPSLRIKLSDMGLSNKRLPAGHRVGLGPGWQPKEVILGNKRLTRAVDSFGLGCVYFFCITAGRHPFGGDDLERRQNIENGNQANLMLLANLPEANELISRMLSHIPKRRPTAEEVLIHPLFWDEDTRLSFLCDTSDKLTARDLNGQLLNPQLIIAVNGTSGTVLPPDTFPDGEWIHALNPQLQPWGNGYTLNSVKELVRLIRNKYVHYSEHRDNIKLILGSLEVNPTAYYNYFGTRFPNLLIQVYKVMKQHCRHEEVFARYFRSVRNI
ncbi:OLC1v1016828C1 [Oldenlandia corymbosa var. corymbosa]|uniref:OLC1v1016828C1 n=1 Tax=Oldenlandia corymbosa var. corymbosa TaxID=529605 RepID=A0AAV1E821_OLDCO|nr:OLC1v1016828C1 [Oldenlandia corymbosa var. corymbosa]